MKIRGAGATYLSDRVYRLWPDHMDAVDAEKLLQTPLHALHLEMGAKMVAFAGYDMAVQYPTGVLKEHLHTREKAGLFDVSHMGEFHVSGPDALALVQRIGVNDASMLEVGQVQYSAMCAEDGCIVDDLTVLRFADHFMLVVNASRRAQDWSFISGHADGMDVTLSDRSDSTGLLALQGPKAPDVLARVMPELDLDGLEYYHHSTGDALGTSLIVARMGYTGEDGFEISVPAADGARIAERLLGDARVRPAGLGARDSLRLEAGLCLYGHDIDETTSPVEAGLGWTIGKRRRAEGGFPGAGTILRQIADGPARRLVGLRLAGRAPARAGAVILNPDGAPVGAVTSGGFGPTVGAAIAMGYVPAALAAEGTALGIELRGRVLDAVVAGLPFVPHRYFKASKGAPA